MDLIIIGSFDLDAIKESSLRKSKSLRFIIEVVGSGFVFMVLSWEKYWEVFASSERNADVLLP